MSRFILNLAVFLSFQILVCFVFYENGRFSLKNHPNDYLASTLDKHARLDSLESPRLILVGGSNLAYGVNSGCLERELGIVTVNMAMHAGLGMDFILSDIESKIKPRDIVVIAFEDNLFLGAQSDFKLIWQVVNYRPAYLKEIIYHPRFIDDGFIALRQIVQSAFDKSLPSPREPSPPYSRDSFNEWGDIILRPVTAAQIEPEPHRRVHISNLQEKVNLLADFQLRVEQIGAMAVYIHSYKPLFCYPDRGDFLSLLHSRLINSGVNVVGSAKEASMPVTYFYDTEYHLTKKGAAIRTGKIVSMLKPIVQSMSKD